MTEYYARNEIALRAITQDFFATKQEKAAAPDPALDSAYYMRLAQAERSKAACALFAAIGRGLKRGFAATRNALKRAFAPLPNERDGNLPPAHYYYYYGL